MSRILITGGAGALGSSLAKICLDMGFEVSINDIVRIKEAWRLKEIRDKIKYKWCATQDLCKKDLEGIDIVNDCSCQADRPLGETSPRHTLINNITAPLRLLEIARDMKNPPIFLYPSSMVVFFGVPPSKQPVFEDTLPKPQGIYSLSKLYAEEIYRAYHKTYGIPTIVTRVGSAFSGVGRSDQFIHRVIIEMLKGKQKIIIWSPDVVRDWTYAVDVLDFYKLLIPKLIEDPKPWIGLTMHNAGLKEDDKYNVKSVSLKISELIGYNGNTDFKDDYESTELVWDGDKKVPVQVWTKWKGLKANKLLGWKPRHTLKNSLKETIKGFEERLEKYI